MKLMYKTHKRVCVRIRRKPCVTDPDSGMYGVGELDFEVANRTLKGNYQAMDGGGTPLHIASQQGHLDVVRLLIEAGAAIDKA